MAIETSSDQTRYDRNANNNFTEGTPLIRLSDYQPNMSVYDRAFITGIHSNELNSLTPDIQSTINTAIDKGWLIKESYCDGVDLSFEEIRPRGLVIIDYPSAVQFDEIIAQRDPLKGNSAHEKTLIAATNLAFVATILVASYLEGNSSGFTEALKRNSVYLIPPAALMTYLIWYLYDLRK